MSASPLPYRAIWERELAAGMYGQDRQRPATWKMDALYRAVCWQIKAEETEDILALALDQEAHVDTIAALVEEVDRARDAAHEAFVRHAAAEEQYAA